VAGSRSRAASSETRGWVSSGLRDYKIGRVRTTACVPWPSARWDRFSKLRDAIVFAFAPPAVLELGVANGFTCIWQIARPPATTR